ncbi:hypothetical protein [Corynebacterium sp. P8-C1]|uniref:hypothetical protein n=1 Tax=Corynebacterium sp. P8-C1 TaxID=3059082 RepID=UPI00265C96A6|nr:hypothetical protein [Corynebacterium sp. P8-C1]WKK64213.1 hypothetical protein QYR04_04845 [Corynebacterium sp. P8-C1]
MLGEVMSVGDQLHLEPDELRALLKSKMNSYNEAIDRLKEKVPEVDTASFGEGFAEQGEKLASAMERVHGQTVDRFKARVDQFEEILRLIADIDETDAQNAEGLRGHV